MKDSIYREKMKESSFIGYGNLPKCPARKLGRKDNAVIIKGCRWRGVVLDPLCWVILFEYGPHSRSDV